MKEALLYTKINSTQRIITRNILEKHLRFMKFNAGGNDLVLDVGSGPGDVTVELLQPRLPKNCNLIGADYSKNMLEFATNNYSRPGLSYMHLDISGKKMPLDLIQKVDHIFSFYCLQFIKDHRQTLKNFHNLLKPGGDMLISFIAYTLVFDVYEILGANPKWSEYMTTRSNYISPYQNCKNPAEVFKNLLAETGFNTKVCEVVQMDHVYANDEVFRNLIISVNPFMENMPENLRDDYLNDFMKEIKKMTYNRNAEKVTDPCKMFIVCANKSI